MNRAERSMRNRRFYAFVLGEGTRCECDGCYGDAQLHHVNVPQLGRRGHDYDAYNVVKACLRHHQAGGPGVAAHATKEEAWTERWLAKPLYLLLFLRLARYARHLEEQLEQLEAQEGVA